ncbi:MAG TPA: fumarylacetoacetate hydrolase family protein [Pseudolabrys sp.]|jgi:2-keto-4-pentenoate hydratase/2-oxohepta-3-ene-1,7-dioic acid hydratase in catechol pathway
MKIAAISTPQGKVFGAVEGENFRPFSVGGGTLRDLRHVIKLIGAGSKPDFGEPVALARAKLAAPVGPLTKNVICVGKNYYDHAREFAQSGVDQSGDKQDVPADPVIFTKSTSSLADPGQKIVASLDPTHTVDYEGEFGVVIGRHAKNVKREDALDYVFGYTIVNDLTARAVQQRHKQWFLGKSLDGFCPVGPYLVTREEFGLPAEQELATFVNDERRQSAKLKDMIFDVPSFIETVTAYVPLEPGDLLATGTPAGVGIGFAPPRYLQPGDVVRISISGLGELTNPVV